MSEEKTKLKMWGKGRSGSGLAIEYECPELWELPVQDAAGSPVVRGISGAIEEIDPKDMTPVHDDSF